jgi:signal transduction histidine kinase
VSFALIVGVIGYASLTSLGNLAVKSINNVNILNDIYDYNVAIDAGIFNMIYISDATLIDYLLQTTKEHKEGMLEYLDKYLTHQGQFSDVFTPGEMQDMVNLLEIYSGSYIPVIDEIFDFVEHGRYDEALSVYVNRFSPIYNVFAYYIKVGFVKNLEYSLTETSRNSESASVNAFLMLAVVLLSLVVSVLLALAVTKSIAVPLSALGAAADKAAHEELDVQFEQSKSNDEIARLSLRLSEMLQYLKQGQKSKLEAVEARHEKEKAEAASKAKGEFLATMSHEIKTPLTVISSHVQKAKRLFETGDSGQTFTKGEAIRHSLTRAQEEIMRTGRLTENALRLASMQERKHQMKPLDISILLKTTAEAYQVVLEKNGNQLIVNITPGLPPVYGDADLLIQVTANLLSNANAHTHDGKIIVTALAANEYVTVTVTDNGSGIPAELLPHVFERQVEGASGTGIGLSICKEIITSHNGLIEIESENGKGSTVMFRIPEMVNA